MSKPSSSQKKDLALLVESAARGDHARHHAELLAELAAGKARERRSALGEKIELTGRSSRFTIAADQEPTAVELDPNVRLLMDGRLTRR